MALTQAALATEFLAVVPEIIELDAKTNFSQAYGNYIKLATANAVPTVGTFIDATLVPAMVSAMTFGSSGTPSTGAAALVAGFTAFWAAAVAAPASFIVGATVIVPPIFAALSAALIATFGVNQGPPAKDQPTSTSNLATDVHAATLLSPTATFGVPVFPII